jgi:hypothetical protein
MASTDFLNSAGDAFLLQSALMGNASALRFKRRPVSYGADADKTLASNEYDGTLIDIGSGTALGATRKLILPLTDGAIWVINNQSTGGQSVQAIGATGTGVTIGAGKVAVVWCNGTNIYRLTADATP